MGTTPLFAIPYVEPTDTLATFPAADKAQADKLDAALGGRPFCQAWASASQSMVNGAETGMVFQNSHVSQAGMFTNGGSVITVPVAGLYQIVFGYSWTANATGNRILVTKVTGFTAGSMGAPAYSMPGAVAGTVVLVRSLAAGATVAMNLYQSSGAALATFNQYWPHLSVVRLGPALT